MINVDFLKVVLTYKHVTKDNLKDLPDKPGIYYLLNWRNKVLYIGQAKSLYYRWNAGGNRRHKHRHTLENRKNARLFFKTCRESQLDKLEKQAYDSLKPTLNLISPPSKVIAKKSSKKRYPKEDFDIGSLMIVCIVMAIFFLCISF